MKPLVLLNLNTRDIQLSEVLPLLPFWRREQALRFRRDADRQTSAAAYLLLQEAVDKGSLDPFVYEPNGKPRLHEYPELHFNLSHAEGAAACALASSPVGIDIDRITKVEPEVVCRVMNEKEQAIIAQEGMVAFFRFWTMKEAFLKLTGEGLRNDLRNVLSDCSQIDFEVRNLQGYVCTTAMKKDG